VYSVEELCESNVLEVWGGGSAPPAGPPRRLEPPIGRECQAASARAPIEHPTRGNQLLNLEKEHNKEIKRFFGKKLQHQNKRTQEGHTQGVFSSGERIRQPT